MKYRFLLTLLAASVLAGINACGGEMEARIGGGGTGAPMSIGLGAVSGFGSLIVNGAHYDERNASAFFDERPDQPTPASVDAIRLGMQIGIEHQNLVASKATVSAELIGPVSAVTMTGFTALGQTVRVNANPVQPTVFDGLTDLADLDLGTIVEVHGQRAANQEILATRVELKPAALAVARVTGTVTGLSNRTFTIGGLTINADAAAVVPAATPLANGQRVAAWTDAGYAGGTLAARVVRIGGPAISSSATVVVDGVIAEFQSAANFTLAGVRVDAGAAQFAGGTAADLAAGRAVRVRGTYGTVLRAERVDFLQAQDAQVQLNGFVTGFIDASSKFKVRGAAVRVSAQTSYVDGSAANLGDGVHVKLDGTLVNGAVEASRLEFLGPSAGVQHVQFGVVASGVSTAADGTKAFRLEGLTTNFRTTATTRFKKGSAADLAAGRSVKVKGELLGQLLVEELQFMDNANDPVVFEIEGIATNVMPASMTVDGSTIALTATTVYRRAGAVVAASELKNGSAVDVDAVRSAGRLIAIEVELKSVAPGTVTVRGNVNGRTPNSVEFRVGSQRVSIAGSLVFEPAGMSAADIRNGNDLEVTGTLVDGLLVASKVRFH